MIHFSHGKIFRHSLRFWLLLVISLAGILLTGQFFALLFTLLAVWGLTATRGVLLRASDRYMKRYYGVFGLKFGTWETLEGHTDVFWIREHRTGLQESYAAQNRTYEEYAWVLCLGDATHRKKIPLARAESKKEFDDKLDALVRDFNLKLTTYSPAISKKTRERKRR